jgi:hypothetical protein
MILTNVCGGAASPANSAPQIYRAAATAWHAQYARHDAEAAVSTTNISEEIKTVLQDFNAIERTWTYKSSHA